MHVKLLITILLQFAMNGICRESYSELGKNDTANVVGGHLISKDEHVKIHSRTTIDVAVDIHLVSYLTKIIRN